MSKFRGHGAKRSAADGNTSRKAAASRQAAQRPLRAWRRYMPARPIAGAAAAILIFAAGALIGAKLGEHANGTPPPVGTSLPEPTHAPGYEVPVRAYRSPDAPAGTYDEAALPESPGPVHPPQVPVPATPVPRSQPRADVIGPTPEQLASRPTGRQPWERNAVAVEVVPGRPMIAIVVDDLGLDQVHTRETIALPAPLTLAFIPYGSHLREHTRRARERGHELLVHLPMEPSDPEANPGQNALLTTLDQAELGRRIDWNLSQFEGYVGLNNHMGSRFTAWEPGMRQVLQAVQERGLLFLDSRTSPHTVGISMARAMGLPSVGRDVFLDNVREATAIEAQLAELERVAAKHGYAIGICHPHEQTLEVLRRWIGDVRGRGFQLVPVSAIVRRRVAGAG